MPEYKHNKTGEVITGEQYDSSAFPLQKGVLTHRRGNVVMTSDASQILLSEGDFIQHLPNGYYQPIQRLELSDQYTPLNVGSNPVEGNDPEQAEEPTEDPASDQATEAEATPKKKRPVKSVKR